MQGYHLPVYGASVALITETRIPITYNLRIMTYASRSGLIFSVESPR